MQNRKLHKIYNAHVIYPEQQSVIYLLLKQVILPQILIYWKKVWVIPLGSNVIYDL